MTARPSCLTTLVAVTIALTVTGTAGAAPGFGDSVSTTPGRFLHRATINATSGPSGNHPSGLVSWHIGGGLGDGWSGTVTCLNVTGKTALVGFTGQLSSSGGFFHYWVAGIIRIVDNGRPAGEFGFSVDDFSWSYDIGDPGPEFEPPAGEPIPGPTDCSTPGDWEVTGASGLASDDDLIVTDTHPFPTSKDQCKNGGWRNFPQFQNQLQCNLFVDRTCGERGRFEPKPNQCRRRLPAPLVHP